MSLINSIGRQLSWDQRTHPSQVVCFSWTFTSQQTIHSSHQSSNLSQKSITQILTLTVAFAWIFSRTNGLQHSLCPKCCSQSAPCSPMLTQTIHSCPTLPTNTRMTEQSTRPPPVNGPVNMPCDFDETTCCTYYLSLASISRVKSGLTTRHLIASRLLQKL